MSNTAVLRQNWRKVSSTDNLQAYADDHPSSNHSSPTAARRTKLLGCSMLALGMTLMGAALLVLVSKMLPPAACEPMHAIQQDQYYIYVGPLMLPMLLIAVTVNWFSLKLFKHNS
ncbi:hypothetical protein OEZ85_014057 [Tetradesmus obliquus]|uniref:Transmembrane protein n=1 Tax=Tetradesmus obliquus TaxID=3088 RepID=A0ABY8U6S7_TETOB|nr:hypothetical protein OEZ85_014057 [Tetradesmus obliquus]